jgi:glycosyltransferase involved in cell wall biosynthesis
MLERAIVAGRDRGWATEAVFTPVARNRPWRTELEKKGVSLRFAPSNSGSELRSWVQKLADESKGVTIFHSHFTAFDTPVALVARTRPRTIAIWHVHTVLPPGIAGWARNSAKFVSHGRLVQAIVCVSDDLATAVRRRGAPRSRVVSVLNGIDLDRFPMRSAETEASGKLALNVPTDRPVLLHLGWDWRQKGGDLFVECVARLHEMGLEATALTVGAPAEVRREIERLPLRDSVRILEARDQIQELYAAADVFLSPSRGEGALLPFAVLEALATGTPVVASDIPAHQLPQPAPPTLQVTAAEPGALARAVRSTLRRSPAEASEHASLGRAWVEENMSIERWVRQILGIYDQALSSIGARPDTAGT